MATHRNWDLPVAALGCSPREFIRRNAWRYTDVIMARVMTRKGFPLSLGMANKMRRELGINKGGNTGKNKLIAAHVDDSPYARFNYPLTIKANKIAVWGDPEFPYHDADFMNKVIDLCAAWHVDKLAVAGDLLHHDSLSAWSPAWDDPKQSAPNSISSEWEVARQNLLTLKKTFRGGCWVALGNHEGRFLAALNSPTAPEDLKRILVGNDQWLRVAPYYYGLIESGGRVWRFTHPKNTSCNAASIAAKLADKFDADVLMGHNHLWGYVQSASGRHVGVEMGCMVDGQRLAYYAQRDTIRPAWTLGAAILVDGHCYLLSERTDWRRMMSWKM